MNKTPRRTNRRKAGILAALAVALVLGLAACYPGGPENLSDIGIVVTFKDPDGSFSGLMTYAMEDTVVELKNPDDDSSEPIDPKYNPWILDELQTQMHNVGFKRIINPDVGDSIPDIWLSVGAVESTTWIYWYNWGYYGGYPGWGWYYPPYVGAASFQQGTVIWQFHDLRGVDDPTDPEALVPLTWIGVLNGAIQSSTTEANIRDGIQQAFVQSPYIAAQPAGK